LKLILFLFNIKYKKYVYQDKVLIYTPKLYK